MKTILKVFVAFVALGLTFSAGYFSVLGLTKMFAGALIGTAVVCSFAEFSKLIIASVLHQYRTKLKWIYKILLSVALMITMFITSLGVYGYLTNGFQQTANKLELIDKQVSVVNMKKERFQEQLDGYTSEKTQLAESISELSKGLSNNVIEYKDRETGEIIRTTSSATRKVLQEQLDDFKEQRNIVSTKIENLTDSVTNLDMQIIELESNNEASAEIGPLKFIVEFTGYPMNTVVNFITLLLVIVIDPLAILLVLVFNKITDKEKIKTSVPEGMEFEVEYPLPEEAVKESEVMEEMDEFEEKSLDETDYLSSDTSEEILNESFEQLDNGETIPYELEDELGDDYFDAYEDILPEVKKSATSDWKDKLMSRIKRKDVPTQSTSDNTESEQNRFYNEKEQSTKIVSKRVG